MLPRARFDSVEPKLLSDLLAPSHLLVGPASLAFESLALSKCLATRTLRVLAGHFGG